MARSDPGAGPGGVTVEAGLAGGDLLHLAAAGCVLDDLYREAAALSIELARSAQPRRDQRATASRQQRFGRERDERGRDDRHERCWHQAADQPGRAAGSPPGHLRHGAPASSPPRGPGCIRTGPAVLSSLRKTAASGITSSQKRTVAPTRLCVDMQRDLLPVRPQLGLLCGQRRAGALDNRAPVGGFVCFQEPLSIDSHRAQIEPFCCAD